MIASAWVSRTVGSQAYVAAACATIVVGIAATIALLMTFIASQLKTADGQASPSSLSGILLAMVVRMGLPLAVMAVMTQMKHPLLDAGFLGFLCVNYLVALPLETLLSLQFINQSKTTTSA